MNQWVQFRRVADPLSGQALVELLLAHGVPARVEAPSLLPGLYGQSIVTVPSDLLHRAGNLRAVQLLLGHSKIESTVRYLGVESGPALPRTRGGPFVPVFDSCTAPWTALLNHLIGAQEHRRRSNPKGLPSEGSGEAVRPFPW